MDLHALLSRFDALTLLVLGDAFVDEYVMGDCVRISPEAPVPILKVDAGKTRRVPGGAANTAANIAALGGKAVLFCLRGNDSMGEVLETLCRGAGVELESFRDERPTPVKTRLVGQRQQLLRLDYEDARDVGTDLEARILEVFRKRLAGADGVVLSDYAKGFLTEGLTRALIRETREAGKAVVLDPRPQHAARYTGCDVVTPNWKESLGLLGRPDADPGPENIRAVGEELRRRLNAGVLLTLGPQGIAFFDRDSGGFFHMPTAAREVYDVSGAGDTVVAAFSLASAAGAARREAVELANRAAGIVVGKLGTAVVTREELLHSDLTGARLIPRSRLAPLADLLRAQGRRIVTINGSFDLLHAGHLYILEEAKAQGDVLIVGLNSDASVKRYKSKDRPIIPENERAKMLLGLRCVDYVHVFDEDAPMAFLEEVKPQVHVNGSEYGENCIEAPTVLRYNGRIHIVKKIPGLSTSQILRRISLLNIPPQ
jgi:D-beta-D-heptose 7-phosphate kinase/D-beta-D-heptose 1-phosphate adenosyltransferase